jgi:hypothetical protein
MRPLRTNLINNGTITDLNGNPLTQAAVNLTGSTVSYLAAGNEPIAVASADLNGDGKLDLVATNKGSNTVSVFLGNGNGSFEGQQTLATGTYPAAVFASDLNGDGKPDLIIANIGSSTVSVLLGNGDGTFQAQRTFATGSSPTSIFVSD